MLSQIQLKVSVMTLEVGSHRKL